LANVFDRKMSRNIGTSLTSVGSYTVPSSTKTIVIGMTVSNITNAGIVVDVVVDDGINDTYVVKGAPVAAGGTLIVSGGEQKMVLITGDTIQVKSDTASSCDAIINIMESS
jgi:hypothetical protein